MKRTEKVIQIDNSTISAGRYDKFSRGTQTFLGTWGKSVHCQTQDPQLVNIGIQTNQRDLIVNMETFDKKSPFVLYLRLNY